MLLLPLPFECKIKFLSRGAKMVTVWFEQDLDDFVHTTLVARMEIQTYLDMTTVVSIAITSKET